MIEGEMGRAASLVGEIVESRALHGVDELRTSDDDLLGAVEAVEDAIKAWRYDQNEPR